MNPSDSGIVWWPGYTTSPLHHRKSSQAFCFQISCKGVNVRIIIGLSGLLLATVVLIPYRYLVFADFIPSFLQTLVRYIPALLSVLIILGWGWCPYRVD